MVFRFAKLFHLDPEIVMKKYDIEDFALWCGFDFRDGNIENYLIKNSKC